MATTSASRPALWTTRLARGLPGPRLLAQARAGMRIWAERPETCWRLATATGQFNAPDQAVNGGRVDGRDPAAPSVLLSALRARGYDWRRGLTLLVPASDALIISGEFPATIEPELLDAAVFEVEKRTPFARAEVVIGAAVATRDASRGQISAALLVIETARIAAWLDLLAAAHIPLRGVLLDGSDRLGDRVLPVRYEGRRARLRLSRRAMLHAALVAGALVLSTGAELVRTVHFDTARAEMDTELARGRQALRAAATLRQSLAQLDQRTALLREAWRMPEPARVLNTVAQIFPDDTWLVSAQLDGKTILLSGYSHRAVRLPALLDGTRLLENARFRAPITDAGSMGDRFEIAADFIPVDRQ